MFLLLWPGALSSTKQCSQLKRMRFRLVFRFCFVVFNQVMFSPLYQSINKLNNNKKYISSLSSSVMPFTFGSITSYYHPAFMADQSKRVMVSKVCSITLHFLFFISFVCSFLYSFS